MGNPSLTAKRNKNSVTSLLDHAIFMTVCKAPRSGAGMSRKRHLFMQNAIDP